MGDLAPRDVVAAAIDARLALTGDPCVYLDARGIDGFKRRFRPLRRPAGPQASIRCASRFRSCRAPTTAAAAW